MIITIICITILAYAISGKDVNGLLDKLKDVNWKKKPRGFSTRLAHTPKRQAA